MHDLTRFFYCKSTEIQSLISNGTINAWDIVFTSDRADHRLVIVSDDLKTEFLNTASITQSFDTREEAERYLETSPEVTNGEIITILKNNIYVPYLVNLGLDGDFYLEPFINIHYDDLVNKPTLSGIDITGDKTFADYGLVPLSNLDLDELLV